MGRFSMSERLQGFRILWDDNISHKTKVEITTDKNIYTDVWMFDLIPSDANMVMLRLYKNDLKNFCKTHNISMVKYNRIKKKGEIL